MRRCSPNCRRRALPAQERLAQSSIAARRAIRRWRASSTWRRRLACRCNGSTPDAALALEPSLKPVFSHAAFWPQAASVSDPLGVTRPMPRALPRSAASRSKAMRARCIAPASAGGWRPTKAPLDAAEAMVALGPWARDLLDPHGAQAAARRQARLSPAFPRPGQCGADAAGARRQRRLCHHADGAGHPHDHRRRIRGARRAADAGAIRPHYAQGARIVSARRARRRQDLARPPPGLSGFAAGDRPRAGQAWPVVGHWPCALGADAWAFDRASARRHDHRRRPFVDPAPYRAERFL